MVAVARRKREREKEEGKEGGGRPEEKPLK
jgi:hypothetical protein